jgi:hypothetical protein
LVAAGFGLNRTGETPVPPKIPFWVSDSLGEPS